MIDFSGGDGRLLEKQVLADKGAPAGGPKVALIDVEGLISHSPSPGLISTTSNTVDELVARLQKAEDDPRVRAVVLRVNSPGGTVAASETVYRELRSFRERTGKPIVVSMAEVAASGGYYISLAADRIVAQPSTITGSIGVIIQTVNFSRGLSWIGIEARAVRSGPNKDIANPLEPIRDEHYALLQRTVDDFYRSFHDLARAARPDADASRFDSLTDGRIFTGAQAYEERLVDSLGDLRDSFAEAKRLAGVDRARLIKYHPEGRTPASPYALSAAPPNSTSMHVSLPPMLSPAPGFYYLWAPEIP